MDDDAEIIEEPEEPHATAEADEPGEPGEIAEGALVEPYEGPDVLLDVPVLKVDEIDLEVEDLRARVSLQAEVLDLLRLNVGVNVELGRVKLDITGVEAQALLKVRLDNVVEVVSRVLATIDRNPQILEHVTSSLGSAVRDIGSGTREAVGELGHGASSAVEEVGEGAGRAAEDIGAGAGAAEEDVSGSAGRAVEGVGEGATGAVEGAEQVVESENEGAAGAVEGSTGKRTRKTAGAARGTGKKEAKKAKAKTTGGEPRSRATTASRRRSALMRGRAESPGFRQEPRQPRRRGGQRKHPP
ncbi:hypothetical protein [Streptomyces sp.]|uniref:hypothetical protein n=1 Tax=Streptomyces sp. TaxID=1931 RepID=UPI002F3E9F90